MNKLVALYIRLSTEDYKVESMSIENQKLALHKFIETQDDLPDCEVKEFVDNGYSGTNFERPAVQELLDLVREGKIACIIVKDFSRFGRNSLEVGYFMEKVFPLYGVRFISINDDFDNGKLHGDTGGLNVAFKYLISEFYSRDLSIKYKSAKYVKFKRGEYQSKVCPYGYQKSADGRMEPNPETAPVVRMIFEMAAQGWTMKEIAAALLERRIPTPGEYKALHGFTGHDVSRSNGVWQTGILTRILDDERYTGTYIIGKTEIIQVGGRQVREKDRKDWVIIQNHHPAIVSKDEFQRAQEKRRHFKCPKKNKRVYPLRSKVFCGFCRHTLARSATKEPYFHCRQAGAIPSSPCYKLSIKELVLHELLYEILSKQARVILGTADIESKIGALSIEQSGYDQQISKIQEQKRVLFEQMILGELSEQEYRKKKSALDNELVRLQEVQTGILTQLSQQRADEETKNANRELARKVVDIGQLSAELVDALIERVYVYPGKNIEIVWKVAGFVSGEEELQKNF